MTRDRPRALSRTSSRALREAGLDPATRARPRRAREPLRDGRRSPPTCDGPQQRARALRRRGVRLHRPARREPARVELAVRVLRVRAPRGAGALDEPVAAGAARARPGAATSPRRRSRETRAAMWRDAGLERTADGLRRLLDDPAPARPARRRRRRWPARRAAARTRAPTSRRPTPALDERHSVLPAGDATPALRRVDVSVRRLTSTQHNLRVRVFTQRARTCCPEVQ